MNSIKTSNQVVNIIAMLNFKLGKLKVENTETVLVDIR